MAKQRLEREDDDSTRREFLQRMGRTACASGMATALIADTSFVCAEPSLPPNKGRVGQRVLGKTGLCRKSASAGTVGAMPACPTAAAGCGASILTRPNE